MRNPAFICSIVLSVLLVLAGCGGGGGARVGSRQPTPEPLPPPPTECIPVHGGDCVPPEDFPSLAENAVDGYRLHENFETQWGLRHIRAGVAYGNLNLLKGEDAEPGSGVTIGFIDTGIDRFHPAFAGKTVTEEFLPGASDERGDRFSHGTAVASVAAAARSSLPGAAHGVAWDADIAMFSIPTGSGDGDYDPISFSGLASQEPRVGDWVEHALAWRDGDRRVDILNVSVGYHGIIDSYAEQELRDNFGAAIAAMAQADASEKTIFVWAAGNAHGDPCDPSTTDHCEDGEIDAVSVEVLPGLAARIEELRAHSIAVVALSRDEGRIAAFSNRCGIAAEFCIAAPGDKVRAAHFGPDSNGLRTVRGHEDVSGTSVAAPMVAGGLALMKQLFRDQLSNTELVARLLETADTSGMYADRTTYGRGSMDLGAATSPVGVLEVPSGGNAGQNGFRLQSTRLLPGAAFGDGLQRSLAMRQIMALDDLGAPFWYHLGSFTAAAKGPPVAARLRGFLAPGSGWLGPVSATAMAQDEPGPEPDAAPVSLHIARLELPSEIRGSHLALAEGGVKATLGGQGDLSAAAFTTKGVPGRMPAVGAALSWRRAGLPLGLRAGWIGERETLLGSVGEGAFGALAGDTAFLGLNASTDLGRWRIGANAELGLVAPSARGGLVARVSSLATSAFALHATRALAGSGALRFSLSQPLRVERGRASLTVPAGRTKQGVVLYSSVPAELAPSGRQMDISGQWHRPLAQGQLRLGTVLSLRPGHRQAADPELTFLAGWRWDF